MPVPGGYRRWTVHRLEGSKTVPTAPYRVHSAAPPTSASNTLLVIVVIVAALVFGREILMPVALAVLLGFALSPIVDFFRRWRLGRVPAVLLVVTLVFLALLTFGAVVAGQIADLADNLPSYERNIRAKIQAVQETAASGGPFRRVAEMVRDLRADLEQAGTPPAPPGTGPIPSPDPADAVEPIPVELREPSPNPMQVLRDFGGPVMRPLATAGMVLVFVIFMLLQRDDLRDRLIRLAGSGDISRTTEAMNDAARRVSRYLLMQALINLTYALPVGLGLYFIGVPNPVLWALLAFVLRFIPYIGPVIAAFFPIALSIAVAPGWTVLLLTAGLFVILELFSNNVVEPLLYGSTTGMTPVAILLAAVFWTTLWGPVGLLLSTPLTVCLVVLGRHVPQLRFLEVMFGDRPVLPVEAKFYQRLLARDPDGALELADTERQAGTVAHVHEEVILPALRLAEQDRQRGSLDTAARHAIIDGLSHVLDGLAEDGDNEGARVPDGTPATILCVGARNDLDEAAAALLADLLRRRGLAAAIVPCEAVGARAITQLEHTGVRAICLSYLTPSPGPHADRLTRRLRRLVGQDVPILLGLWSAPAAPSVAGAPRIATSLSQAAAELAEASDPKSAGTLR